MSVEKLFQNRLSELRGQKGVSARDMSLTLGQSPGYINGIENGILFPSMTQFFAICDYLGVSPSVYFDFDNHDPKKSKATNDKLRGLTSEQLSIISSIIDQMKS